jgi:hypothetical protein
MSSSCRRAHLRTYGNTATGELARIALTLRSLSRDRHPKSYAVFKNDENER